jgi:hypothetical protein
MSITKESILKAILLKEFDRMQPDVSTFEDDPMQFILRKYEGLNKTLTYLMTPSFQDYVTGIYIVAPKPTTFKIVLHNGQFFFLQFTGKTYEATVAGKGYYLMNIGEKERCMLAIARLLRYGNPLKTKGPEGAEQGTRDEAGSEAGGEAGGGEAAAETPPAEGGAEEEPIAETKILEKILFNNLIKEESVINESQGEEKYDELIKTQLKETEVPKVSKPVKLGEDFNLSGADADTWKKLFVLAPPTAKGDESSKGSGKGEVSTYWLFNQSGYDVKDGRGGENSDLIIGGVGCEVKSYPKGTFTLGKYSSDKKSLKALNILFGLDTLVSALKQEGEREYNPANFNAQDLINASKIFIDFYKNETLRKVGVENQLDIINSIYTKVDALIKELNIESEKFNEKTVASKILLDLFTTKLTNKPGSGNYILNCNSSGKGVFYKIDIEKLKEATKKNPDLILNNIKASQAEIKANFDALFKS